MRKIIGVLALILLSFGLQPVTAQDDPAPYLYYYSRMLGGIIIERADGTDSRHIGADVIPPGMSGLRGLGWSPSGRYFLATGFNYSDGGHYNVQGIYLFNDEGQQPIPYLATAGAVFTAQWSPDGDNLVMIVGGRSSRPYDYSTQFFRLVDPTAGRVLAEFEATAALPYPLYSPNFVWDFEAKHIIFYIVVDPEIPERRRSFRVTMNFDGSVLKEPLTEAEYDARPDVADVPYSIDIGELSTDAIDISPSGRYQASGHLLQDLQLETELELPAHSQETICRKYIWSADEQYMIALGGTLIAGGGCGWAVIGVTDVQGQLWRELGSCSWDVPACVSWLPPQVDVDKLPFGQPKPIQLDPVAYEPNNDGQFFVYPADALFQFRCLDTDLTTRYIVNTDSKATEFTLYDYQNCPYSGDWSDEGVPAVVAYNPDHQLLATYTGHFTDNYVSIWKMCPDGIGVKILKLNSYGNQLEFTPDGQQLRAKNYNAWKIYDVDDILAAATDDCEGNS